jgi:hypothetical protein
MGPNRPCIIGHPGRRAHLPERQREPFRRKRLAHEVIITDRGAAESDEDIGSDLTRAAHPGGGLGEAIRHDAEIDQLTTLPAGERQGGIAVEIIELMGGRPAPANIHRHCSNTIPD